MRRAICLFLLLLPTPLAARDSLGVFGDWGAFRDAEAPRCYAITAAQGAGQDAAYASVGTWPRRQVRGQLHIRLARPLGREGSAQLRIGEERFALAGNGHDLWAADPRGDAAIVTAMRAATSMRLTATDARGRRITVTYSLDGAATALDAASVGCARTR